MPTIQLEEHRNLFRDDAAFEQFVAILAKATENYEISSIEDNRQPVATVLSPAGFRALFGGRMLQKLIDQPAMLEELKRKLQTLELEPTHRFE